MTNKKVFKVDIDGTEHELCVKRPTPYQRKKGDIVYASSFRVYVEARIFIRATLDNFMREEGMWNDVKQLEYDDLQKTISKGEALLERGGVKLSEAKETAIKVSKARRQLAELLMERNEMDAMTAEGRSNNDRFNYLVSVCTVYNDTGKPVFASLEDYEEKQETDLAVKSASALAELLYNFDQDFTANLPEIKFLKQHKFVDDKLNYINKDGKKVDELGNLVDEEGRLINDNGELLDVEKPVEQKPFLDDDGQEIAVG